MIRSAGSRTRDDSRNLQAPRGRTARTTNRGRIALQTLFGEVRHPGAAADDPAADGPFAAIALEQSIDRLLHYSIPKSLATSLRVGQRVRVPLGRNNRAARGYVVSIHPTSEYPKIKPLAGIEDERVLFRSEERRVGKEG